MDMKNSKKVVSDFVSPKYIIQCIKVDSNGIDFAVLIILFYDCTRTLRIFEHFK